MKKSVYKWTYSSTLCFSRVCCVQNTGISSHGDSQWNTFLPELQVESGAPTTFYSFLATMWLNKNFLNLFSTALNVFLSKCVFSFLLMEYLFISYSVTLLSPLSKQQYQNSLFKTISIGVRGQDSKQLGMKQTAREFLRAGMIKIKGRQCQLICWLPLLQKKKKRKRKTFFMTGGSFTSCGKIPREVSSYLPIDTGSQRLYLPWFLYFKKKVLLRDAPGL